MDLIDLFFADERKPQWSTEMFEKLVKQYVPESKMTDFYKAVMSDWAANRIFDSGVGSDILEDLFQIFNGMEEIYNSSGNLMFDLEVLQNFPNNSKFLGLENSMNYLAVPRRMESRPNYSDGSHCFLTRCDAYIWLVQNYFARMDKFSELMAKSVGNRLRRQIGWWDYAYLQSDLILYRFEEQFRKFLKFNEDACESTGFRLPEAEIAPATDTKSIKTVFTEISQFYDAEYDGDLLIELIKELERKNKTHPITQNYVIYLNIFTKQYTLRYLIEHFFGTTEIQADPRWDIPFFMRRPLPVIRVFTDKNDKFIIKDEMRMALDLIKLRKSSETAQNDLFSPEITDDSKHGIFHTVKWEDFENILKDLNLSTDDFHLIDYRITGTSRGTMVPVPIGSDACKLGKFAFSEVFEQIFIHLRRPNDMNNLRRVFKFFASEPIFSNEHKNRFFIKVEKIQDIVKRVWIDLSRFPRLLNYQLYISTYETFSTKKEMFEKLQRFAPKFEKLRRWIVKCLSTLKHFKTFEHNSKQFLKIYEIALRSTFLELSPQLAQFMEYQGFPKVNINPNFPDVFLTETDQDFTDAFSMLELI